MAQPKRKSPEKKPAPKSSARKPQQPSIGVRALESAVAGIARYPRLIGGGAIFCVVFSFVAANALWYQPRHHPAPLLATRMFEGGNRKKPSQPAADDTAAADPTMTTFRIERQDTSQPDATASHPVASPLVKSIQQALAERGLYDGTADGVSGPKTTAAILFFEETEGLAEDGNATPALLAKLKVRDTKVAVIPDERPSPDITASTRSTPAKARQSDDVADLIRAADDQPATVTQVKATAADSKQKALSTDTVMQIQKALTRFAYADIKVDGVAGEATRTAIRAFEKSYGLPVTGIPSERVVKKLKQIGAY